MAIDLGDIPTGTKPSPAEKLQIRSSIGVGQTDAPTFLAQTLTGQSLTGTQATSLVDLATTWNTDGNPSLIYGRVTNTKSGTAANLIDLGTFAGGSLFKVSKNGAITNGSSISANGTFLITSAVGYFSGFNNGLFADHTAIIANQGAYIGFSAVNNSASNGADTMFFSDAAGILAQRNGSAAQTQRTYNNYTSATVFERGTFGFPIGTNTLRIGTEFLGAGMAACPIEFVAGGVRRGGLNAATGGWDFGSVTINYLVMGNGLYFPGGAIWGPTAGLLEINTGTVGAYRDLRVRNVIQSPGVGTTVTPASNGDLVFETTSNTSVTLKLKGTDGTVRSVALTLA